MDINSLHEHNREAYQKVMQHFNEGHQKACVVHATGTGKSMIITAVSDHFERVLILTTNMFTIEQVDETFKKYSPERTVEPTFMIYQALLQQMRDDVDYSQAFDLIIFDEFH
ncbi:MAG: DEAD/DEAH box helicase family protein, partial [Bacteroidaceae bacterium]|nr:DEAD/DEAH box helicase family protein [Bacteroidaceae bacterium]